MTESTRTVVSDRVRRFLAEPRYATIATVDPDGGPRQAVIWYLLDGDDLIINSRVGRRWPNNLVREPRISIAVTDRADEMRWVGLSGNVEVRQGQAEAQADIAAMARRYEDPDTAERSIRGFEQQERISFRVSISAVHDHLD